MPFLNHLYRETRGFLGPVLALAILNLPVEAKEFRSNSNLEVFQKGVHGDADHYLGFIREEGPHTVEVPSGTEWYVHPVGKYSEEDFLHLAQEIKSKKIPGLSLTDRWGTPLSNGVYYIFVTTTKGRSMAKLIVAR